LIDYKAKDATKKCRLSVEKMTPLTIHVGDPGRKAKAIRRTLKELAGSSDPYPFLLSLADKIRLLELWGAMSPAIAAGWYVTHYEDDQGFEIYFTPPS
jgi:hypothetical protein